MVLYIDVEPKINSTTLRSLVRLLIFKYKSVDKILTLCYNISISINVRGVNEYMDLIIEEGDSVKFGEQWCEENGWEELKGKTIMLSPQYFEEDNGLYTYTTHCLGICDEVEEPYSIYHLFGNNLENFMDCELIKGFDTDKENYQRMVQDETDRENEYWESLSKDLVD